MASHSRSKGDQTADNRQDRDNPDVGRRSFLTMAGAAAASAIYYSSTASATQVTTPESGYGANGYGELGYGSIESVNN